jgi:formylglycine-generating enzyme
MSAEPEIPDLALIEGGTFMMGSPDKEFGRDMDESVHQASLTSFFIGKREVSFSAYDAFCAATGRTKPPDQYWGRGTRPVLGVSWFDAVAYCNWISDAQGLDPAYSISGYEAVLDPEAAGYRLPTEAEWEYACRAGTSTPFAFGEVLPAAFENFDGSFPYPRGSVGEFRARTIPIGSLKANPWGLYDMHGNVQEWCWDWYGTYPADPQDNPLGAESGIYRVARGGSWYSRAVESRSAFRDGHKPEDRSFRVGFRLARSVF